MDIQLSFTRALVRKILLSGGNEWTVQGFGFLRTYFGPPDLPKQYRLNLWDSSFTKPGVSTIHDHPWDFKSLIVAGNFRNQRYTLDEPEGYLGIYPTHAYTTIKTGTGGGLERSPVEHCVLRAKRPEVYLPGDTYHQDANEIHETEFMDGSITLNERHGDTEHARVFWPAGTEWVDAEPRPATPGEVKAAIDYSLKVWF